jgi:hypothetical protein
LANIGDLLIDIRSVGATLWVHSNASPNANHSKCRFVATGDRTGDGTIGKAPGSVGADALVHSRIGPNAKLSIERGPRIASNRPRFYFFFIGAKRLGTIADEVSEPRLFRSLLWLANFSLLSRSAPNEELTAI